MRRDTFERRVRGALTNLYDPVYMQTDPLTDCLDLCVSPGGSKGEALRDVIWDAVEALKPDDSVPLDQPAWFSYRILWLHYIQGMSVAETCDAIALSTRSFRRYRQRAVEAVAGILWGRYERLAGELSPQSPAPDAEDLAEARRFARSSSYERCRLEDVIRDVTETIRPLISDLGIELHQDIAADAEIYGDPALLAQIMLNALMGALPALMASTIRMTVGLEGDQLECRLGPLRPDRLREVWVDSQELRVSRVLLETYGGQLIRRDLQGACLLTVLIPSSTPEIILAVDDDPSTIGLYARYLEPFYLVEHARSVEEAAARLQQLRPGAILLDVLMPHEDGWKLLRTLRSDPALAGVPVIVCSVLSQPSLALALGADRVLQKPISRDALRATIRELLHPPDSPPPPHPASPPTA